MKQPNSWLLLGLGFSAGLPFLLTGSTLGFWMRQEGLSLTLIGFMSWVSFVYGLKVLWAPWMDRVKLPFLYRWLGQRRSFMLLSQIGIIIGIVLMAIIGPKGDLLPFGLAAMFVAFAAASQEIAIDAWRVEQTQSLTDEAMHPTFYAWGYRIAVVVSGSLILIPAEIIGWPLSFMGLAVIMSAGICATLLAKRSKAELSLKPKTHSFHSLVIEPFESFFKHHGRLSLLILLTLAVYRLPDYLIGPVAGPLYEDTGLTNTAIASMRSTVGLAASFIGVAIGGGCILWLGIERSFWLGALTGPLSNICFSLMAIYHADLNVFAGTLIVDNIANGIAETAFVAFLTRLTVKEFTLTHYALMYSVSAMTGKLLKGFSGQIVDQMTPSLGLFGAYQAFFIGTAVAGLPALILCLWLRQLGIFKKT
jgi:MFS transporter, PAT family, beta-lactamase induction signal transducer AmpG